MSGGFTLLESLLASIVLALVVGAVLMPFAAGASNTAHDARQTLAVNLAQDLMEEVLAKPFDDPDGEEASETARSTWNDIGDYDGYSENEGAISSFDGVTVTDPATKGMSRSCSVKSVYVAGQGDPDPPDFMRVTVQVRHKGQSLVTLSRLVYNNEGTGNENAQQGSDTGGTGDSDHGNGNGGGGGGCCKHGSVRRPGAH